MSEFLQALAIVIPLGFLYIVVLGITAGVLYTLAGNKQNETRDDDELVELVIEKPSSTICIDSPVDVFHYVKQRIGGKPIEYLILLLLTSDYRLAVEFQCTDKLSEFVRFPKPEMIIQHCIGNEVSFAFLVHNHPQGTLYPSGEDVHYTAQLAQKLQQAGIGLIDHIVVTEDRYYSMRDNDHLGIVFTDSQGRFW